MNKVILNKCKEEWRPIQGYEGIYEISNEGRIKSLLGFNGHKYIDRERMLNPYKQKGNENYFRSVITLTKNKQRKSFKVHRLVAKAFIPKEDGRNIINHKDGNPLNNSVNNLEWCTQKENMDHASKNKLLLTAYNAIDRDTMTTLLNNGFTYDEIADKLGVAKGTVFNYIKRFKITKKYI